MEHLIFFDPAGRTQITHSHAPRLDTLQNKCIGLLSNDQWQAYRVMPFIKECLETQFPGCRIMPVDTFPQGVAQIADPGMVGKVTAAGVDAVIIGNAS